MSDDVKERMNNRLDFDMGASGCFVTMGIKHIKKTISRLNSAVVVASPRRVAGAEAAPLPLPLGHAGAAGGAASPLAVRAGEGGRARTGGEDGHLHARLARVALVDQDRGRGGGADLLGACHGGRL